jgi:cytochrome c oxidase subunit 2
MFSYFKKDNNSFKFYFLGALGFQESATPLMEGIIDFHNVVMTLLLVVFIFVVFFFGIVVYFYTLRINFPTKRFDIFARKLVIYRDSLHALTHMPVLEFIWTIIPALILFAIAKPSLALLYAMDEVIAPTVTVKVLGSQWYWSYEYACIDNETLEETGGPSFDSYMVATDDLELGDFRLLEVDNEVVVPAEMHLRFLITANDVLHSWSVNALGLKVDAVPGRLNQLSIFIKREGVFYGQCSELCGVNHGFMPIVVKAVSPIDYFNWVKSF